MAERHKLSIIGKKDAKECDLDISSPVGDYDDRVKKYSVCKKRLHLENSSSEDRKLNKVDNESCHLEARERAQAVLATVSRSFYQEAEDSRDSSTIISSDNCSESDSDSAQGSRHNVKKNVKEEPLSDEDEPLQEVVFDKAGHNLQKSDKNSWKSGSNELTSSGTQSVQVKKSEKEKPFKCDLCDVACTQRNGLLRHKRIHTGEKPYKCDACAAEFTTSSSLKQHKLKHTGEKPFKCGICSQKFAWKGNFDRHVRQHSANQPYKCKTCGVAFESAPGLKRHERTHLGPTPYKCNMCGKDFAKVNDYYFHRKKEHAI